MSQQEINKIIVNYLKPYDPVKIGLFGSYARNEQLPDSDIDIYLDLKKKISLFDLGHIYLDLEKLLGVKVDILTPGAIRNERLRKSIERDLKIIYEG